MKKRSGLMRTLALLATLVVAASACTAATATKGPATGPFKIGYSNGGGVGNGFREEQVCTAKAQAKASAGQVSDLTTIHRNTDAAGQLSDMVQIEAGGDVETVLIRRRIDLGRAAKEVSSRRCGGR